MDADDILDALRDVCTDVHIHGFDYGTRNPVDTALQLATLFTHLDDAITKSHDLPSDWQVDA